METSYTCAMHTHTLALHMMPVPMYAQDDAIHMDLMGEAQSMYPQWTYGQESFQRRMFDHDDNEYKC